jgi:hypothetical protein
VTETPNQPLQQTGPVSRLFVVFRFCSRPAAELVVRPSPADRTRCPNLPRNFRSWPLSCCPETPARAQPRPHTRQLGLRPGNRLRAGRRCLDTHIRSGPETRVVGRDEATASTFTKFVDRVGPLVSLLSLTLGKTDPATLAHKNKQGSEPSTGSPAGQAQVSTQISVLDSLLVGPVVGPGFFHVNLFDPAPADQAVEEGASSLR